MTDTEVIQALGICTSEHLGCEDGCPRRHNGLTFAKCRFGFLKDALDLINRQKAEIERLQKLQKQTKAKCGTCFFAKPTTFGKSKSYVECTNKEHIEKFCRYRKISLKRQRTTPACKCYKEMEQSVNYKSSKTEE